MVQGVVLGFNINECGECISNVKVTYLTYYDYVLHSLTKMCTYALAPP